MVGLGRVPSGRAEITISTQYVRVVYFNWWKGNSESRWGHHSINYNSSLERVVTQIMSQIVTPELHSCGLIWEKYAYSLHFKG